MVKWSSQCMRCISQSSDDLLTARDFTWRSRKRHLSHYCAAPKRLIDRLQITIDISKIIYVSTNKCMSISATALLLSEFSVFFFSLAWWTLLKNFGKKLKTQMFFEIFSSPFLLRSLVLKVISIWLNLETPPNLNQVEMSYVIHIININSFGLPGKKVKKYYDKMKNAFSEFVFKC